MNTNHSNYVIVYIWEASQSTSETSGKRPTGHVSMQLFGPDVTSKNLPKSGYISIGPSGFIDTLADDCREIESNTYPDRQFVVYALNIKAIQNRYEEIRNKKWSIWGAGMFKGKDHINCSGLVVELLVRHGGLLKRAWWRAENLAFYKTHKWHAKIELIGQKIGRNMYAKYTKKLDNIMDDMEYMSYKYGILVNIFSGIGLFGTFAGIKLILYDLYIREREKNSLYVNLLLLFLLFVSLCCYLIKCINHLSLSSKKLAISPTDVAYVLTEFSKRTRDVKEFCESCKDEIIKSKTSLFMVDIQIDTERDNFESKQIRPHCDLHKRR